ncbi:MAG: PaaI family thioesterase [Nitrospirae bacterium]|nr:MAG: PaaI family thioesterase [Nitrospirota bacterium]
MKREDIIKDFVQRDRLAQHLGIEVYDVGDGSAKGRMKVSEFHLNSAGTVHGGAIFALADAVFSAASNSHGTLAMAINVSISYFKAGREGTLFAEAREVSVNPKLGTYLISIKDDKGQEVALFQGTVYRKSTPLEDVIEG